MNAFGTYIIFLSIDKKQVGSEFTMEFVMHYFKRLIAGYLFGRGMMLYYRGRYDDAKRTFEKFSN